MEENLQMIVTGEEQNRTVLLKFSHVPESPGTVTMQVLIH